MTKTHKVCRECNEEKTIDNFYINTRPESKSGNSWNPRCKPCVNKIARYKHKANPLIRKNYHLRYNYGITLDEYNKKFNAQNGKCAICSTSKSGGKGTHFYVDHNHTTKKIRGLLCHSCNFVIGNARENTDILTNAINYLEYWIVEGGAS